MAEFMIVSREQREKSHFDHVYNQPAAARRLRIDESDIRRYRSCPNRHIYGKECIFALAKPLRNRDVLEIGCGCGFDSVLLAANGANVFAYDVSEQAIEVAQKRARINGVAERIRFAAAADPAQAFPARQFDLIFGNAVLHHLRLEPFARTLPALLRPGGVCVFREPAVLNPWTGRLRRCIPWYPTGPTADEAPLDRQALAHLAAEFDGVETHYFESLSRIWHLLRSPSLIDRLHRCDAALFDAIPRTRQFASVVVTRLSHPRRGPAGGYSTLVVDPSDKGIG